MHAGGRFVCQPFPFVLGCDHTCAVLRFCSYDLLLHAVFAEEKTVDVFLFDSALTLISLLVFISF